MNAAIFDAALRAGCPRREAQVLATYVESESVEDAADKLGITRHTAAGHLGRAQRRLRVPHTAAAVAKLAA